MCPRGFTNVPAGSLTSITANDCSQVCAVNQVCSPEYSGDCLAGRYCLDGTESQYQYASAPGYEITSTGATSPSAGTPCTGTYCPPGSPTKSASCPAGYRLDVTSKAHSQSNCVPNDAGTISTVTNGQVTSQAACPLGSYCPEASTTGIPCEPGTYSAKAASDSSGPKTKSECTACPSGSFCPAGSSSDGTGSVALQTCSGG